MGKEIITNAGCHVLSNGGCFIISFLQKCTTFIKIVRINISEYIKTKSISIKEYLQ